MAPDGVFSRYNLTNDGDSQAWITTNVEHQLFVRGIVFSKNCYADTTFEETGFYNFAVAGDRFVLNVNPYYRTRLEGLCGNYDFVASNDEEF